MPSDYNELMKTEEDSVVVHQLTFPGYSLQDHLNKYHYSKKKPIDFTKIGQYKNKGKSLDFVKIHRYKDRGDDMERIKKIYSIDLDIDTVTKSTLELTLEKNNYDFIIIQDHGSMIAVPNFKKYIAEKSLERLGDLLIKTNNTSAQLIYFTEYPNKIYYSKNYTDTKKNYTWKPYDTVTCKKIEPQDSIYLKSYGNIIWDSIQLINSPIEDMEIYENGLYKLQQIRDFEISPTARIFDILKTENPKFKMYGMAGHPSKITSFMFACVYYEMTTGKSCIENKYGGKISKKKADIVKKTVHNYLIANGTTKKNN